MKRIQSVHQMPDGEIYGYPDWYYETLEKCKEEKRCVYCGKPKEGRKITCSLLCHVYWRNWAGINSLRTNSIRREIHKKFGFACTECGEMFYQELPSGVWVPRFWGECHHVIPLKDGGPDTFENQTLLCRDCHKLKHAA